MEAETEEEVALEEDVSDAAPEGEARAADGDADVPTVDACLVGADGGFDDIGIAPTRFGAATDWRVDLVDSELVEADGDEDEIEVEDV